MIDRSEAALQSYSGSGGGAIPQALPTQVVDHQLGDFFYLRGFTYAKFLARDTSRLRRFHHCRVFAHCVSKIHSRRMREDAKSYASAQL